MHFYKVRVILEVYLFQLNSSHPFKIKILNTHLLFNILITYISQINRLNLTCDNIILNHKANYRTIKSIKVKMLASYNNTNKEVL